MGRRRAEISFSARSSVSHNELREFITDALESWGGQRHPDDHLFESLQGVKVKFVAPTPSAKTSKRGSLR